MENRRGGKDEIAFKGKDYSATFDELEMYLLNQNYNHKWTDYYIELFYCATQSA